MKRVLPLVLALAAIAPAHADQAGPWQIKVGLHVVDPKSDNGTLADGALKTKVDSAWGPTFALEYAVSRNLGVEVLAALPFKHDVELNGAKAATVKHLPPTVSLNWHFAPDTKVNPFLGLGVNYTRFFSIDEKGPIEGAQLNLDASWGLAAHAGLEFSFDPRWSLIADVRWIDIETDAKVNGAKVGTVKIDPLVYGVAFGYRF